MSEKDVIVCGVLKFDQFHVPIFFIEDEGAFGFVNPSDDQAYYISQTAAKKVVPVLKPKDVVSALNDGTFGSDVEGVIYVEGYAIIIIDEFTAENRPYTSLNKKLGQEYSIDLDAIIPDLDDMEVEIL